MAEQSTEERGRAPKWLRIVWMVFKQLIVPLLCFVGIYIGLYIGYVKLGGQPAADIWDQATWRHLIDLVFG
jgi:hypothetical protein